MEVLRDNLLVVTSHLRDHPNIDVLPGKMMCMGDMELVGVGWF